LVKNTDIIHLHWINHSFLTLKNLEELNKLQKPIVITMHDMWYATGGCHHSRTCFNYTTGCGNCMFLSHPKKNDISAKQFAKKKVVYSSNLTFVGCSNWLTQLAEQSPLLSNSKVLNIPNPIDISLFIIQDKKKAKQLLKLDMSKKHILFAAANVTNSRKGYKYLEKALEKLKEEEYEIIVLGDDKNNEINFAIPTIKLGYVSDLDTIITAYNAADVFVSPTLEDNLPNTIMESMSCGTPCVAFKIGGIPDLIDHKKNGYLAQYMNSEDLSSGIKWVLSNQEIGKLARKKVETTFSEEKIASQFIELYESLI
jgi:glycosyltransferase involved in cell wall biosynthesis